MSWNFDARAVEPSTGFEIWPDGWFPVVITGAEEKPNESGDGMSWHLAIRGLDGPVKDKKHTIRINHKHSNQQTMDIAQKTMSAICHVTNVLAFQHPGQLANVPFMVKSGTRKGKGENADKSYQDWSDFKNMAGESPVDIYKRLNGQGGGAPMQQQQPAQGGQWGGQPQQPAQGGQWGQQPQHPPQQAQQPPAQGGGWPQQQQPPAQQQQPPAGQQWQPQGQQPTNPPMQQGQQPPAQGGWGGGQPTQPAQQPQQGQQWQPQPGQGGGPAPGSAPWGAPQG